MAAAAPAVEAQKVDSYLVLLFLMLSSATLFEGFDAAMLSFAAPDTRASLGIDRSQWGLVNGITRMGVMASFLFLFFADRLGRRAVMLVTVLGFTIFNGLTAFVTDKVQFTACQTLARLFLTAEISLAVIIASEEFPARLRARTVAILISLATVGVMAMAKLQPYVLLPESAEPNWIHSLGAWLVARGQALLGQEPHAASWRGLYVLSLVPLVLILVLRLAMRETRRFEAVRSASPAAPRSLRQALSDAVTPWRAEYRARTAMVALLWNCVFLVTAPSVVYWVIFAREDLGLTAQQVGDIVFWGYGGGVAGHFTAGWLIDRVGRKWTCAGFYVIAAISIAMLYQIHSLAGQYFWMIATVFSFAAANTATHVYASELFPTEIRATGYGWTTNFAGRVTEVATPIAIGALSLSLGIPTSIAVVAIGPVIGAILVLRYAPETRGLTLEQIADTLAAGRTRA
jgi:MFS transporter, putative metabolite:H+ symporter